MARLTLRRFGSGGLDNFTKLVEARGFTRSSPWKYEWSHPVLPKIVLTLDHAYQVQWDMGIKHGNTLDMLARTIEAYDLATKRFEMGLKEGR